MRQVGNGTGFTLVELVVTLVIIGALAAVSAPIFFSADAFRQRGFFNETLSAVRYAQKLAVASGCTVRVQVTAAGFALRRAPTAAPCNNLPAIADYNAAVTDPSGRNSATAMCPAEPAGFCRDAPPGIALTPADFAFTPLGAASATVTIGVTGTSGLRVWADTGFVERL